MERSPPKDCPPRDPEPQDPENTRVIVVGAQNYEYDISSSLDPRTSTEETAPRTPSVPGVQDYEYNASSSLDPRNRVEKPAPFVPSMLSVQDYKYDGSCSNEQASKCIELDNNMEEYFVDRHFPDEETRLKARGASSTLVLLDLPNHVDDESIMCGFLDGKSKSCRDSIEAVRLRHTPSGRRVVLVEFKSSALAAEYLKPGTSTSIKVWDAKMNAHICRVEHSYPEDDGSKVDRRKDAWDCPKQCGYETNLSSRCIECERKQPNDIAGRDGSTDEDPRPGTSLSNFIVIRGLASSVDEAQLAAGVVELYRNDAELKKVQPKTHKLRSTAPVGNTAGLGAEPGSLRRVFLIRDRATNRSWRYGFAEYNSWADAERAVQKFRAMSRFSIAGKRAIAAVTHAGVFVPVAEADMERLGPFAFPAGWLRKHFARYWDQQAYASPILVPPHTTFFFEASAKEEAKFYETGSTKVDAEKANARKADVRKADAGKAGVEKANVTPPSRPGATRRAGEPETKEVQGNRGLRPARASADRFSSPEHPGYLSFSSKRKHRREYRCHICDRQFSHYIVLYIHERDSERHHRLAADEMQRESAIAELARRGLKPTMVLPTASKKDGQQQQQPQQQYRDRAQERRIAFGQPDKPVLSSKRGAPQDANPGPSVIGSHKRAKAEPKPLRSKGAALLSKMGWGPGQGLGAEGAGRTETVGVDLYRPGAGLGAQGAKIGDAADEAARRTEKSGFPYSDFIEKTKEGARKRFEELS